MSLSLFDTHLHLGPDDSAAEILTAARAVGVDGFVLVASDLADAERLLPIAAVRDGVYSTAGVHPHEAVGYGGDLTGFEALVAHPKVCAVGEIGLDYYYDHSPREQQCRTFEAMLDFAAAAGKPAIVHCRDAYDDCLAILRGTLRPGQPFEIHSYTGSAAWAEEILAMGGYLAYNGIATFRKGDNVREALKITPLDRLLLETDSPYLAPVPHRGRPNQPAYLLDIARYIAEFLGLELTELADATTANARQFFGV